MRKKTRKNKKININQTSFYFEDYIETNKKINSYKKIIYFKTEFIYYFFYFFHLSLYFA